MNGIKRLREFVGGIGQHSVWSVTREEYDNAHGLDIEHKGGQLRDLLADIADQIEREQDKVAMTDWEAVRDVRDDMARHVSGIPEFDDLVDEWVRKLDDAFDGRERRDPAADVSVSAYDLLPDEDREAIAWMREHGGLSHVKDIYNDLRAVVERLGIEWSESELHGLMDALDRRLVPEGGWPRFEDGEMVLIGSDFADWLGETHTVTSIEFFEDGVSLRWNPDEPEEFAWLSSGERVRRPAPKVLDADGEEIRVGDSVWDMGGNGPYEVVRFTEHGYVRIKSDFGLEQSAFCERLTHRAPVLAADGKPLREGETMWFTTSGGKLRVDKIEHRPDGFWALELFTDGSKRNSAPASVLTHERPVLDADGVPIKVGDTVYEVGENYPPFIVGRLPEPGAYRSVRVVYPSGAFTFLDPERLTHTKLAPPDSWERLEEDVTLSVERYRELYGIKKNDGMTWPQLVRKDLVRRAKALSGDA